jgi:hypothetical protein
MTNNKSNKSIIVKIILELLKGIIYCAVPLCILVVGLIHLSQTKSYILVILMIFLTIFTFAAYTNWVKIIEYIKEINIPEEF